MRIASRAEASRRRPLLVAVSTVVAGMVLGCSGGEPASEPTAGGDPWPAAVDVGADSPATASGSLTITEPGTVIEGYAIEGSVRVEADDVTIRDTRIVTAGRYGITAAEDVTGLLVEQVTIIGTGFGCSAGIGPDGSWTLRRSDISGCVDGIKVRSHQVVEENRVHDLRVGQAPDGTFTHNDAIQSTSGTDVVIRANDLEVDWAAGANACLMLSSDFGPLERYRIEQNRFSGGQYVVSVRDQGHGDPRDMEIVDNTWVRDAWRYGPVNFEGTTVSLGAGNRYDDGTPA